MKKLKVTDACIGCGLCNGMNPDAFILNEDNLAQCVAELDDAAADEIIASCPAAAIEE